MRPIPPAYDPRIFTRTQYAIMLDQEREDDQGVWGRFRRWRLRRRDFLTYADAAFLFSIDVEDIETMIECGYLMHFEDVHSGRMMIDREKLEAFLFSEEPIPEPPLTCPLTGALIPLPPAMRIMRY